MIFSYCLENFYSAGFSCIEPTFTKNVIKASYKKYLHDLGMPGFKDDFPYVDAIILMLCPIMNAVLESLGHRMFFHFAGKLRSALCGLIFEKTLRLNITSQSGMDSGRLLTLISADARNIAELMPMFLQLVIIPVLFFVPLVFLLLDLGACSLLSLAVVVVCMPLILITLKYIGVFMKEFLRCNDYRTKLINETFEGIRVVKFSGLESFFVGRIEEARKEQVEYSCKVILQVQLMHIVIKNIPALVNYTVIAFYIFAMDKTQSDFIQTLQPNIPYLTLMTSTSSILPLVFEAFMLMNVSFNRINDFLVLPETEEVVREEPVQEEERRGNNNNNNNNGASNSSSPVVSDIDDNDDLSVVNTKDNNNNNNNNNGNGNGNGNGNKPIIYQIKNGKFKWNSKVNVPKTLAERQAELKAKKEKEREEEAKGKFADIAKLKSRRRDIDNVTDAGISGAAGLTLATGIELGESIAMHSSSDSSFSPSSSSSEDNNNNNNNYEFLLNNINLSLREGTLTMIVGSVGCGKSSLGATVVNDIEQIEGEVRMKKGVSIAYCPQTPWIVNGTVRENIMLSDEGNKGKEKEEKEKGNELTEEEKEQKYQHVVHVCALETDFNILAAGDMTMIGEKGVNLSGGQKARIQLARSIYADRDFYILDDPLSAVDAHVGRFLFNECIIKELKERGKTIMLMTNQLQFLGQADNVVVMNEGEIVDQGTEEELKSRGIDFSKFLVSGEEGEDGGDNDNNKEGEGEEEEGKDEENNKLDIEIEIENVEKVNVIAQNPSDLSSQSSSSPSPSLTPNPIPTPQPTPCPEDSSSSGKQKKKEVGTEIMTEEEQITGGIPWKTYFKYWHVILPNWRIIYFGFNILMTNGILSFSQYWLGVIGSDQWQDTFSFNFKIHFIAILMGGEVFFLFIQTIMCVFMEKRSGNNLHSNLINNVIQCPSSFFDTTPLGRVINRFTGDLTQVDMFLQTFTIAVAALWLGLIGQIIIVAVDYPIFILIGVISIILFYLLFKVYSRAVRNFQRLESMARSPVLSVFSEILSGAGLTTIRSFGLEGRWLKKFNRLNDDWTSRFVIFREGQRWATTYGCLISFGLLTCMIIIGWNKMEPAKITVAIQSALMFGIYGMQIIQQNVELESRMTSLQRVLFYSKDLPQEVESLCKVDDVSKNINIVDSSSSCYSHTSTPSPSPSLTPTSVSSSSSQPLVNTEIDESTKNYKVPETWPSTGTVEFDHVSYRYRPGLPFVLKDVSFCFRSGEKIGVCGRTGAGKSSLIFPLFRLVELDPRLSPQQINPQTGFLEPVDCNPYVYDDNNTNRGRILIDGVDIANVDIHRLRRSLAIIPQDPTLFTGTLRNNLDLSGKCTDEEIWEVLELVSLKDIIEKEFDNGLDTQVTEGGRNFSCGQRQLICFGRAMLQKTKVVLMDEATANVDVETDAKIQNTIRNVFKEQTVIVVAHRLNTIINSDRILVMDKGSIAELDTPQNLLNNPDSSFNGLVKSLSN